jgi:hypothetical protein
MWFLLRVAFWLGLVFVLLPTGKSGGDTDKASAVDPMQAATAAASLMQDMSQFCSRQPTACEVGGKAAIVVGERAQSGVRKVYQFITEKAEKADSKDEPKSETKSEIKSESKPEKPSAKKRDDKKSDHTGSIGEMVASHNTLTDDDLTLEWQAPAEGSPAE